MRNTISDLPTSKTSQIWGRRQGSVRGAMIQNNMHVVMVGMTISVQFQQFEDFFKKCHIFPGGACCQNDIYWQNDAYTAHNLDV